MVQRLKILVLILLFLDIARVIFLAASNHNFQILSHRGIVALDERNLMIAAILIMLIVVIPVLTMAIIFARKYRAGNTEAVYEPEWDHNTKLQIFWWTFPISVITILSVINWIYAHRLDPHQPILSSAKPLTIEVVAMRWKWLFIYPDLSIATVNYVEFPAKTPINFELTGEDAPMNSFWIPQLGGQIYAMSGMATQTHLMADSIGEYRGSSAEISGQGFSGMRFVAKSVSTSDFNTWVRSIQQSSPKLTPDTFTQLSQPSENNPPGFYSSTESNLYTKILMKYMPSASPAPSGNPYQMAGM